MMFTSHSTKGVRSDSGISNGEAGLVILLLDQILLSNATPANFSLRTRFSSAPLSALSAVIEKLPLLKHPTFLLHFFRFPYSSMVGGISCKESAQGWQFI